eukprot:1150416-Pelagomonas_calceolata.AAC.5
MTLLRATYKATSVREQRKKSKYFWGTKLCMRKINYVYTILLNSSFPGRVIRETRADKIGCLHRVSCKQPCEPPLLIPSRLVQQVCKFDTTPVDASTHAQPPAQVQPTAAQAKPNHTPVDASADAAASAGVCATEARLVTRLPGCCWMLGGAGAPTAAGGSPGAATGAAAAAATADGGGGARSAGG